MPICRGGGDAGYKGVTDPRKKKETSVLTREGEGTDRFLAQRKKRSRYDFWGKTYDILL